MARMASTFSTTTSASWWIAWKKQLVLVCVDGILEDTVLPQVGPLPPEIHGKFLKFGSALEPGTLLDETEAGMLIDELDYLFLADCFFGYHLNRVHVHHRGRNDHGHRGDGDVGQHGEDVRTVVAGNSYWIQDDCINGPFLDLSGIGSAAHHDRVDMSDPEYLVDLMDYPAQARSITRNHPDKLPPDCVLEITRRIEGETRPVRAPPLPARVP